MRDEAEIRGHRRTYIGALPGQVIQGLRRAESKNLVFILDEIDKLGSDFGAIRARRSSRCSIRNRTTLSATTIWTCRSISEGCYSSRPQTCSIRSAAAPRPHGGPGAARLHGGREVEIAREHLVEKQVKNHGLTPDMISFTDDALHAVIRGYTREAGVRNLEREIGALAEGRSSSPKAWKSRSR